MVRVGIFSGFFQFKFIGIATVAILLDDLIFDLEWSISGDGDICRIDHVGRLAPCFRFAGDDQAGACDVVGNGSGGGEVGNFDLGVKGGLINPNPKVNVIGCL